MKWKPIETAPRDGTSFRVPEDSGYTHAFWQDGYWWWHGLKRDFAVGPEPSGWLPMNSWPIYRAAFMRGFLNGSADKRAIALGLVLGVIACWWFT